MGCFWCTNFWVPDPPPPTPLANLWGGGQERTSHPFVRSAPQEMVTCFTVLRDTLWSGSMDRTVMVWDSGHRCVRRCAGHSGPVWCLAVQGDAVWSGGGDGEICIWE